MKVNIICKPNELTVKIHAIFVTNQLKMEDFRIREILDQKGMKAKDLADKLGTSQQYVSRILRGETSVSITRLKEIADILGVSLLELFSDYKSSVAVEPGTLVCPHCGNKIRLTAEK